MTLLFLGIYLAILLWISFRKKASANDFILAERKLSLWATAHSLAATAIGGGILLVGGSLMYTYGISAILFFVGKVIGYFLLTFFIYKMQDRIDGKKYCTLSDYFFDVKGPRIGLLISVVLTVVYIGWVLIGFSGGAQIITQMSGWPYEVGLGLMLAFILLYMLIGGFRNVVRTDTLQWGAMCIIFVIFLLSLRGNLPLIESAQWNLWNAGWSNILSFFLAGILFPFSMMEVWQRMYALDKKHTLVSTMSVFSVMYLALGAVLCLIVMLIRTFDAGLDPEFALIIGITNIFPAALVSLGTVAFFAAIMSSVDSYLFTANATIVHDFLDGKKKMSSEVIERKMKYVIGLLGLLTFVVGIFWKNLTEIAVYFSALTIVVSMAVLFTWILGDKIKERVLVDGSVIALLIIHFWAMSRGVDIPLILVSIASSTVALLFLHLFATITKKWKWNLYS